MRLYLPETLHWLLVSWIMLCLLLLLSKERWNSLPCQIHITSYYVPVTINTLHTQAMTAFFTELCRWIAGRTGQPRSSACLSVLQYWQQLMQCNIQVKQIVPSEIGQQPTLSHVAQFLFDLNYPIRQKYGHKIHSFTISSIDPQYSGQAIDLLNGVWGMEVPQQQTPGWGLTAKPQMNLREFSILILWNSQITWLSSNTAVPDRLRRHDFSTTFYHFIGL